MEDQDQDQDQVQAALAVLNQEIESKENIMPPDEFINTIICGSCLEVLARLPDRCIDTCVTDPPWGIGAWTFREKFKDKKIPNDETADYIKLMDEFPARLFRVMKNNSNVFIFCGGAKPVIPKHRHGKLHWPPFDVMKQFWKVGFIPKRVIVWDKMSPGRAYRYRFKSDFIIHFEKGANPEWFGEGEFKDDYIQLPEDPEVIHYPKLHGSRKVHVAEKPVRLYEAFIMDTTDYGALVLDPFAGSGPVVEAAKNTGRKFLAIEMDQDNIKLIENRRKQISIYEIMSPGTTEEQVELVDEEDEEEV